MAFRIMSRQAGQPYVYLYAATETPSLGASFKPPAHDHDVYDDPVFFSTNRTRTGRLSYLGPGLGYTTQNLPLEYGQVDYVLMQTPLGVLYAYVMDDSGAFTFQAFENGVPANREVQMTIMHKGSLVFVADNRQPTPRKGDV